MRTLLLITSTLVIIMSCAAQEDFDKTISKNGMNISWEYQEGRIHFTMSAPTDGWVTIGFNTTRDITGAYLLMGNIIGGQVNVVAHYTLSPGNYKPIDTLGEVVQVLDVMGFENSEGTTIGFSLPIKATNKYQKELSEGTMYTMIIAYSQEDDFQHHSSMRTFLDIKL